MSAIAQIKEAISHRKPIKFEYLKEGKVRGWRFGNPHIAFAGKTQEGDERTYVHIVQTDGVSDTLVNFPDWRMFIVELIGNVEVMHDEPEFALHDGYNPAAAMYSRTIARV